MAAPAIGIDLGATFSCVGVWEKDKFKIISNDQGNRTTPSYVAFNDSERLIGDAARNQVAINPGNTIYDVKRLIGRRYNDPLVHADMRLWPFKVVNAFGKPKLQVEYKGESKIFTPEEISSMVLIKLKEAAECFLGAPVFNAVVTVPAYFNDSQRQATKDAAAIAGLNLLNLMNEPTAAALAFGVEKNLTGESNVLIFDLGGGSCDVSILTITEGLYEVKATVGDTHLGGEDFDTKLVQHFINEFKATFNKDMSSDPRAMRRLRTAAERAKRTLSSVTDTDIVLDALYQGVDFNTKISRDQFEVLCADMFNKLLIFVDKAMIDARLNRSAIDEIVLVGGSSRIPKIQSILQKFFPGKKLSFPVNPDEAVVYGAAVQAAILDGASSQAIQRVRIVEIAPLSLGIETAVGILTIIINRTSQIPCKQTQVFTTNEDNQATVIIQVYEGEQAITKENNLLGQFEVLYIPPAPKGVPQIVVTFELDEDGILSLSAFVPRTTDFSRDLIVMADKGRLSQEDIHRMVSEAELYKKDDEEVKNKIRARNKLEEYVYDVKHTVVEADSKFAEDDKNKINQKCEEVLSWIDDNTLTDAAEYERQYQDLYDLCLPHMTEVREEVTGDAPVILQIG